MYINILGGDKKISCGMVPHNQILGETRLLRCLEGYPCLRYQYDFYSIVREAPGGWVVFGSSTQTSLILC